MSAAESEPVETGFQAIIDAGDFDGWLEVIDAVADECTINIESTGLRVAVVDPANVAMCSTMLGEGAFESYQGDGGVIGVNIERLRDAIGLADAGDLVSLTLNEETRKLQVDAGNVEMTIALIDPDSIRDEPELPDLDLTADVEIEGRELARAVTAADLCSDHIGLGFDMDAEAFYAEAEGDTDDVSITWAREDLLDGSAEAEAFSLFSLDYLDDVTKPIPSDTPVQVRIGEELPVKLHYDDVDGAASTTFMLAPRVTNQ